MWTYHAYVALQLADEKMREADRHRLAALAREGYPERPGLIRRATARALASVSSSAAAAARRLDHRVADDRAECVGSSGLAAGN